MHYLNRCGRACYTRRIDRSYGNADTYYTLPDLESYSPPIHITEWELGIEDGPTPSRGRQLA